MHNRPETKALDANAAAAAYAHLKRAAMESAQYVAYGNVYANELHAKHGGSIDAIKSDLHCIVSALCNSIREL